MSKSTTKIDKYDDESLPLELQDLAERELRETRETREYALQALRQWIERNPRIERARMDTNFLLRFLRAKKFSVTMAQESIERFILLRSTQDGLYFQRMDMYSPRVMELLDLGYIFCVPKRDHLGRRILFYRPGVFDPVKYENVDMIKIHGVTYETLMENEENQIRGFVHIVDCAGLGLRHMTLFTPKEAVRIVKNGERIIPMRHKDVVAFNINPSIKFAVDFGMALISEKMRKRIRFYSSLDHWKSQNRHLLPKEYGGQMPMKEMIESWKKELAPMHQILLSHDQMKVRLDMYTSKEREGAVGALKHPLGCGKEEDNYIYGKQGTFRKLEVD